MSIKQEPPTTPPPITPPDLPPARSRRRRWLWSSLLTVVLLAVLLGGIAGYFVNRDLPDVRALEDYQPPTISQILAEDGQVVHQFAEQKRIVVPLSRINEMLKNAVIAVEDANFHKHVGVDPFALLRAAVRDVMERRWAEGGSTLTQQLTKILFTRSEKTMRRKIQEAILAVQIEKTYTKDEILEFYLNQIYMGHGRYGMEAASQFFFGVPAASVSLEQAALLAGMVQRPTAYSPIKSPQSAARRRNHVLERMAVEGYITREESERAKKAPVTVVASTTDESEAPYFSEEIRKILAPRYGDEALLREGLAIQTGLDLSLQRAVAKALSKGLRDLDKRRGFRRPPRNVIAQKLGSLDTYHHPSWDHPAADGELVTGLIVSVTPRAAAVRVGAELHTITPKEAAWTGRDDLTRILRPGDLTMFEVSRKDGATTLLLDQEPEVEGAALALDPATGDIKAMQGGFDFNRSQFNRASQAQRQCGSAFKPFIYGAAVEEGRSPSDLLLDQPTVFLDKSTGVWYQPENYERRYEGVVTLRKALEESLNVPTVVLLNQVGYERTVEFAHRLGLVSRLFPYPSLALGTSEVSLMELTAAYGVFPTGGILSTPRYFSKVLDRSGNVLEETRSESREVLRADVAAVMVSMMRGVVERGTAAGAARAGAQIAGKTGTTDDYTDAWFIGYSPTLVLGVWVGHDKKLTLGPRETGARAALPIWIQIMDDYLSRHPGEEFPTNPDVVTLPVDRDTGLRAAPEIACSRVIMETFLKGTEIERPCTANAHARLGLPYFLQRYLMTEDGRLQVPEADLERLLRENPFHLDLVGRTSLNALGPGGLQIVRLDRGAGNGADVAWGFFRRDRPGAGAEQAEDLAYSQLLPAEMAPLGMGPHPFVGLDGRTAAITEIQYP